MRRPARWIVTLAAAGVGLLACSGGLDQLHAGKDASVGDSGGAGGSAGYETGPGPGGSGASGGSDAAAGTGGIPDAGGAGGNAGASGAAGSAGAAGAGGAPGAGSVVCGSATCDVSTGSVCCGGLVSSFACVGPSAPCSYFKIACDGPEDCPGQLCCANLSLLVGNGGSSCQATCSGLNLHVVCGATPSVCPSGTTCKPYFALQGYKFCQ